MGNKASFLCVSVVVLSENPLTTEPQRHRVFSKSFRAGWFDVWLVVH